MDMMSTSDPFILKSVKDSKRDECRSTRIKFVRVQLELDYSDLAIPAGPAAPNTVLWGEYYIQLPQNTKDLTNNKNTQYRLTTCLGGDDICTLPPREKVVAKQLLMVNPSYLIMVGSCCYPTTIIGAWH
jgi:hypothetical protein